MRSVVCSPFFPCLTLSLSLLLSHRHCLRILLNRTVNKMQNSLHTCRMSPCWMTAYKTNLDCMSSGFLDRSTLVLSTKFYYSISLLFLFSFLLLLHWFVVVLCFFANELAHTQYEGIFNWLNLKKKYTNFHLYIEHWIKLCNSSNRKKKKEKKINMQKHWERQCNFRSSEMLCRCSEFNEVNSELCFKL